MRGIIGWSAVFIALIFIAYLSVFVRMSTFNAQTILDYDPWWFYRHTEEILNNDLKVPEWDTLSYFPPGRPSQTFQGWPYIMIAIFKVISFFIPITFMEVAKLAPVIMVALTTIPAFLLGKSLSNKWGGIFTALFAVLAPTLIGVSMAGYSDTDAPVLFMSFLCTYAMVLAIKKRKTLKASIPYYIFAIALNLFFIYTWFFGWYVILFFTLLIPALFLFRLLEDTVQNIVYERKLRVDLRKGLRELKPLTISMLIIIVATNIIAVFLGLRTLISFVLINFGFISGTGLIVNISVAELQVIDIFTEGGVRQIAGRIGWAPFYLTVALVPLVLYKLYKKEKIHSAEIFLFLWAGLTFYMILHGIRFSLQFSAAAATAAGYVIGNLAKYLKRGVIAASIFGFVLLFSLIFVSEAIQIGYSGVGMEVSQNWIDMLEWLKGNADEKALITTWWDPGHIIAGYTGLRVHADGAHCGPADCYPYNHNVRIQDMGRIFSTSSEKEAVEILQKYTALTPEQCQEVRNKFGDKVPEDACGPVSEVYIIASNDLIAKYYWLSFFGTGTGRNFFQIPLSNVDQSQGILSYGDGTVSLARREDQWVPVYQNKYIIKELVYFENGELKYLTFENATDTVDGLLWVDPSFQISIFMDPAIKDSIFVKLFFWNGQGLEHFELKYNNPEIRLYKVNF